MKFRRVIPLLTTVVIPLLASGCGSSAERPPMGTVSGTVIYNGKRMTKGSVVFTPIAGRGGETGQGAVGPIESDGSYTLTTFDTGDGAILGQHVATVEMSAQTSEEIMKANTKPDGTFRYVLPKSPLPPKYLSPDTSPFRFTVEKGSNTFNLELKD